MKRSTHFGFMLALIFAGPVMAQTGEVSGLVKDSSGASIPKAVVRIQNTETGAKSETLSNQGGFYALTFLKLLSPTLIRQSLRLKLSRSWPRNCRTKNHFSHTTGTS